MLRAIVSGATVVGLTAAVTLATANPAAATPSTTSIIAQITSEGNALEKIVEQYDGINQQLKDDQAASAKLELQIGPTLQAAQQARAQVGTLAEAAYMRGSIGTLSTLVSSDSTDDMLDALGTLNELAKGTNHDVATYQTAIDAYQQQKQKLDNLIAAETAKRASLNAQKAIINKKLTSLYALRAKAYGSSMVSSGGSTVIPPYIPGRGGKIVDFAYKQLGKPYAWAADGPGSYDCSGLVLAAYRSIGISLYHEAAVQYQESVHIPRGELSPGDLVFYEKGDLHHVAIYIGNNQVIHAPTFGDVVKISPIDMMVPYGYGRIK
jgi:cell wall-associated NlpC family hydrolase